MASTALDEDLARHLDGTPVAHVATVLPDGSPHSTPVWIGTHEGHVVFMTGPGSRKARNLRRDPRVAVSLTPPDDPFCPVSVRGRVVGWLEGEAAWTVVDRIADKYVHQPYDRSEERVVALIDVEHHTIGF